MKIQEVVDFKVNWKTRWLGDFFSQTEIWREIENCLLFEIGGKFKFVHIFENSRAFEFLPFEIGGKFEFVYIYENSVTFEFLLFEIVRKFYICIFGAKIQSVFNYRMDKADTVRNAIGGPSVSVCTKCYTAKRHFTPNLW